MITVKGRVSLDVVEVPAIETFVVVVRDDGDERGVETDRRIACFHALFVRDTNLERGTWKERIRIEYFGRIEKCRLF